jgi:uncharacterized protein YndB with AHSA1/START domain
MRHTLICHFTITELTPRVEDARSQVLSCEAGMPKKNAAAVGLDAAIVIAAPASEVLRAFFDPAALGVWWQAARSVTTPRALGAYAVEWRPTEFRDEILGRLGGVFRGIVMHVEPESGFFVADAYWLPPDGEPIGPMALEVTCTPHPPDGRATRLRVTQTGGDETLRWRRYYEVIGYGWERALASLKALLEH